MILDIICLIALLVMVVADFGVVYGHFAHNQKMFQLSSGLMMIAGAGIAYLYFFTDCGLLSKLR